MVVRSKQYRLKRWFSWARHRFAGLLLILLLAFGLRFYHYGRFPVAGETMDEYAWTFLGSSLLERGEPISWSHFAAYQPFMTLRFAGGDFPMVRPVMDHPPLFSFLPGLMHSWRSDFWFNEPSILAIRLPMVFLGVVNVALFYFWLRSYFSQHWSYLGALFWATIPGFVFASRLVVAENLLLTWLLLVLILLGRPTNRRRIYFLIVLAALSLLTKMSGIVVPIIIFAWGWQERKRRVAIAGAIGALIGLTIFALYGFYYDWSLFWQVLLTQSDRAIGWATLANRFFLHPGIVEKITVDGYFGLGLLALPLLFAAKNKIYRLAQISLVVNLGFLALFVGENTWHNWYNYLLYPFLILALLRLGQIIWRQRQYWLFAFGWLWLLPLWRELFTHRQWSMAPYLRPLILLAALPWLASRFSSVWPRRIMVAMALVLLAVNILVVIYYRQEVYWQNNLFFNPIRVGE